MDPITHAVSGAVLARALPRYHLPPSQVMLLAVLAMLPDADYILTFISDTIYLRYHRGITHSILMLPLWTWLLYAMLNKTRTAIPAWLIAAAIALHIGLDLITSFGTMILAPFSDWRAALDLVFIIDPMFTGLLALPLLLSIFQRRRARRLAWISLLLMFAYLGGTLVLHQRALQLAQREQPAAIAVHALPQPFSPFRWQLIATYPDHYRRALVDMWPAFPGSSVAFSNGFAQRFSGDVRPPDALQWQTMGAMRALPGVRALPGAYFYLWFARFPVLLEKKPGLLVFGDLRFGAGAIPDSPFRLEIRLTPKPRAWLAWQGQRSPVD